MNGDGLVSADEAKQYFPKFNLPQPVLKNVWAASCREGKSRGGLTQNDFELAMKHICHFLNSQQQQQPSSSSSSPAHFVPIRSSPSPSPMMMMGGGGMGSGGTTPMTPNIVVPSMGGGNNGAGAFNFAISNEEKSAYEKHFYGIAQGSVTINGMCVCGVVQFF